jgi:hypothetical protein
VSLGRNFARHSRTARARPGLASAGAARAAQLSQPAQRAVHGASARTTRMAALHGEPTTTRHRRTGDGRGDGWLTGAGTAARHVGDGRAARWPGRHDDGPGDAASDRGGRDVRCRGDGARGETASGRREAALSGRRRAVPTALLMCGSCAAHGSHAETTRYHVGPARRAASDRWDPLIRVFCELKFTPDGNSSK